VHIPSRSEAPAAAKLAEDAVGYPRHNEYAVTMNTPLLAQCETGESLRSFGELNG
jgi:hypothetical protein